MCISTRSVRLIIAASLIVFIVRHPSLVQCLEENEELVDNFANSTVNYWQLEYNQNNSSTIWYLSTHEDPPPFVLDSVRPPVEENGGGFIEVVPYSDAPAQIHSYVFDLLPGATVELTYWNIVPFPVTARNTVLILYTEFVDLLEHAVDAPPKSVQVFTAPLPTEPSPGWTTVTIDLQIKQPSKVQLRLDGNRANLAGTGLAISRIAIKNGVERSTTISSTIVTSTFSDITSSSAEIETVTSSTSDTTTREDASFPNPTKFEVEKSTLQILTTSTSSSLTTTTSPSPATTIPSTTVFSTPTKLDVEQSTTHVPITTTISTTAASPSTSMKMTSSSITDSLSSSASSTLTSASSTSSETTMSISETTYSSSTTSAELTSSPSTMSTTISPSSSWSTTSTRATSTTTQNLSTGSTSPTDPSTSSIGSTTSSNDVISTAFTSPNVPATSTITTVPSSLTNSPGSMSTSATTPLPNTPPLGMTSQLRGIAIGVSVFILLLVLSCLLFGFLYRRHRRRIYLIEKSQLEAGTIRPLEHLDQIPSVSQRAHSDCSSTSSITASDAPLVPASNGQSSVKDFLARFTRVPATSATGTES